ncbi:MAG: DUF2520 domain-containing protein [Pyrinomonadaceae bacterium]|nr:DUF2520 domain-containing protein [Pyrinomonadaceae bacterium]
MKGKRGDGEKKRSGAKGERVDEKSSQLSHTSPFHPISFPSPPLPVSAAAIIGAGRLGGALAHALDAAGFRISALVTRRLPNVRRATRLCSNSRPLALSATQLDRLPDSDLFIITTPDDTIAATAAQLASAIAAQHWSPRRRVALHASGALSSDALAPLRALNFAVGSMHPLASITDAADSFANLRGAFYCVEGDRAATNKARELVCALGGESFTINKKDKALYHAAAVMTAGHAVALFDTAAELLVRCGLTPAKARHILQPLLQTACANLRTQNPSRALTGTFARADLATVQKHLAALRAHQMTDALELYVLLGLRSLALAKDSGVDATKLKAIARALCEERD